MSIHMHVMLSLLSIKLFQESLSTVNRGDAKVGMNATGQGIHAALNMQADR